MADVTLKIIRRVYLRPGIADKSMYHTAMATDTTALPGADGERPIKSLTFIAGVARDVPALTFDLFKDLGIATTETPRRPWDVDEDAR